MKSISKTTILKVSSMSSSRRKRDSEIEQQLKIEVQVLTSLTKLKSNSLRSCSRFQTNINSFGSVKLSKLINRTKNNLEDRSWAEMLLKRNIVNLTCSLIEALDFMELMMLQILNLRPSSQPKRMKTMRPITKSCAILKELVRGTCGRRICN